MTACFSFMPLAHLIEFPWRWWCESQLNNSERRRRLSYVMKVSADTCCNNLNEWVCSFLILILGRSSNFEVEGLTFLSTIDKLQVESIDTSLFFRSEGQILCTRLTYFSDTYYQNWTFLLHQLALFSLRRSMESSCSLGVATQEATQVLGKTLSSNSLTSQWLNFSPTSNGLVLNIEFLLNADEIERKRNWSYRKILWKLLIRRQDTSSWIWKNRSLKRFLRQTKTWGPSVVDIYYNTSWLMASMCHQGTFNAIVQVFIQSKKVIWFSGVRSVLLLLVTRFLLALD